MPTPNPKMFGDDAEAISRSWSDFSAAMSLLFKPGDIIEFRCLNKGLSTEHLWATLDELAGIHDQLCQWNDEGRNVYYGCNPRTSVGGTKATDVAIANALFLDRDGGCTPEELKAAVNTAGLDALSYVMASGGGSQGGWPLENPIPVEEWCAIQRGINAAVEGADVTICDAPRIMRAPGFVNRKAKYGPDFPFAHTVHLTNTRHDHTVFPVGRKSYTPPTTANGQPVESSIDTTGQLPTFAGAFLTDGTLIQPDGKGEPSRRETAFKVAIEMAAGKFTQAEAADRIGSMLTRLGLDAADVEDFVGRQLPNAYSQQRTPTIDPDKLPTTVASKPKCVPVMKATALKDDKWRVVVEHGGKRNVEKVDCGSSISRNRFIRATVEMLGPEVSSEAIDDYLKAVAVGDVEADESDSDKGLGSIGPDSFITLDAITRPERFAITDGESFVAGTTVPRVRQGAEGLEGMWLTFLTKSGGSREAVELPTKITVGERAFHIHPQVPPPGVEPKDGWSDASQWAWLETGQASMEPAVLFEAMVDAFDKFLHLNNDTQSGYLETLALWTVSTYFTESFEVVPYMAVTGPRGSGKSRVMQCLNKVVFRAHLVANPTAASLYRHLHYNAGTVIVDEAENLESSDPGSGLLQTLLTSNTRGMCVPRCDGDDNTPVPFNVFGPKCFISIATPKDTLIDRSIHLKMFRAPPGCKKSRLHPKSQKHHHLWQSIRDGLNTMALTHAEQFLNIPDMDDVVPDMLPRTVETWGVLLQLAAVIEGLGVPGLLAKMQTVARAHGEQAEKVSASEEHEAILRAYVALEQAGRPTTSNGILNRALLDGIDPKITDKEVGKILDNYGFTHHTGKRRREWFASPELLGQIATNYKINLSDEQGPPPPEKSVTTVTTPVFPEKTGRFEGDASVTVTVPLPSPDSDGDTSGEKQNCHRHATVTRTVTPKTPENTGKTAIGDSGDTCDSFLDPPPTDSTSEAGTVSGEVEL